MAWNAATTDAFPTMTVRVEPLQGAGGASINAYVAQPSGAGPFPGVVLIAHAPGWDEFYREFSRRFADHGFIAVAPNIYGRFGEGAPEDVAARARGEGGVADATVIGDAEAAMTWIKAQPSSNGKVGIIGTCSGGRHALLVASSVEGFGAVADLWGGNVIVPPERLNEKQPVAVIDLIQNLTAPIIGLFGNDDTSPSPDQVNQLEAKLNELGKNPVFHRYDGAGHGFFYYQGTSYRPQAAMDGWTKVEDFFKMHLA
jgi:carboxymethylenebutenolidase